MSIGLAPRSVPLPARRRTELGLVVMAIAITVGAYVLGALGRTASLPANIGPFLALVAGLLLVAHIAVRVLARGADPSLLPIAALLNGIGYVFIARLDDERAAAQATWTLVGIAAFVATLAVVKRIRDLQRYQYVTLVASLVLLLSPLVPGVGVTINDSNIWVRLGPLSFQPGEFAKIGLAIFFAAYLVDRRQMIRAGLWRVGPFNLPEPRHLFPVLIAWAVAVGIMGLQNDLGAALLFFTLFVVLLWVSTERAAYLVLGLTLFVIGVYGAYQVFPRVDQRVDAWLNPWASPQGSGFQIIQGSFALAWGGVTGTGIGLGDPGRVPAAHTDFILSTIGEELGLAGTVAVLSAYVLLVGIGLRVALKARGDFEKLLAVGLTTIIGVQAFIIMGGVTRLLPLTGVTLPFVSYGGSSLVANYVILALLVRLSHDVALRNDEVAPSWREKRRTIKATKAARAPRRTTGPADRRRGTA
jgi:cell division protein FtsW (lipid II flippase)